MITREVFLKLCREEVRSAIAQHADEDPLRIALNRSIPEAALVATQVKYLQRARVKLPRYAEAGCILPPLAFEQASSEPCAAHKRIEGEQVLDLTCGLGVDAVALSRRFRRVVTLERNEVLAEIARENFARLGVEHIEVVATSAEEYLATCNEHFDWIYADPDRRSAEGKKLVCLEDCSPNIIALYPQLKARATGLCLKNSPLFDVDEARRYFPASEVEVVSLDGECKEVMIYDPAAEPRVTATALGMGSFSMTPDGAIPTPPRFDPNRYGWLVVPDVALQKARLVRGAMQGVADVWSENGYAFAVEEPKGVLGRVWPIERIEPYDPKALKRELKGSSAELMKRDLPISTEELRRRLGVKAGDAHRLAFTKIEEKYWTIRLK